jgi:oxygen-independent coproporphyrinogen III oxidase
MPDPPQDIPSLYVHVPFCAQKCAYCAFFSEVSEGDLMNRYVGALIREMELVAVDLKPRTVFFGGGTPSLLNLRQWEQILRAMERLNLLGAREFTVECNPATVSSDKAKLLRTFGVNRVSMGVQSLDEKLLDRLGRVHSRDMVFKSFEVLRRAGFDNLNLDLMFAIPGQTLETWQETVTEALAFGSEHLSCYEVIYEEDTPLFAQLQAGEVDADEDLACAMYERLIECAAAAGFRQYEVANFARDQRRGDGVIEHRSDGVPAVQRSNAPTLQHSIPALACQHNVNYWRGGSFYGLGPSATSYVRGVRTKNRPNTRLYCDQLEKGDRAVESREELAPLARAGETAAFGLRLVAGWPFEEFRRTTGYDLRKEWSAEMNQLAGRGWGHLRSDGFQLTPQGLRFADAAAELFLR